MIGLQLYTVRGKMKDSESAYKTMLAVKDMGYECVQLAGTLDVLRLTGDAAKRAGLKIIGFLVNIDICEECADELFDLGKLYGILDIGISSAIQTENEAFELVERANRFAVTARANGYSFSYHNHASEFIRGESGKLIMDILIENFKGVDLMPDTYWLQYAGNDVVAFLDKAADRIKILHLKDLKMTQNGQTYAELGMGNLNLAGVLKLARDTRFEYLIVEQDRCDKDELDCAKISYEYLKRFI